MVSFFFLKDASLGNHIDDSNLYVYNKNLETKTRIFYII